MNCPSCNKIVEDNPTECPQCGFNLRVAQGMDADTPTDSPFESGAVSDSKSATLSDLELWHKIKRARIKGDWDAFDKLCEELLSGTIDNTVKKQIEDFARVSHTDEILTNPVPSSEIEPQLLENTLDLVFEGQILTQVDASPRLNLIDQPEDPASEFTPTEEDLVLFRQIKISKPTTLELTIPISQEKFEALGSVLFLRDTETSSVLDNIVRFGDSGSRILLTGYGSFGGTAIVNRAVQRAREELQKTKTRNNKVEGLILVARVQVRVHSVYNELESLLQQMIQEFYFETTNHKAFGEPVHAIITNLKEYAELLGGNETNVDMKMGYSPTVGAEIGAKPKFLAGFNPTPKGSITREKSPNVAYLRILEKLEQLGGISRKHGGRGVLNSIRGLKYPSRVVLVFDGITNLETFLALEEVLFTHGVSTIVIIDQHNCDNWETRSEWDQLQSRFDHMYVPCIWNISDLICAEIVDPNYETGLSPVEKDFYRDFKKHLEFMSRGMPGESRRRIARSAKGSSGKSIRAGGKPEHVAKIRQNARFNDLITNHWEDILEQSTVEPTEEHKTDIARQLLYYMLDWIRLQEDGFSMTDGFKKFLNYRRVSEENLSTSRNIFNNLARLMVEQRFLTDSDGVFRLGPFFYPGGSQTLLKQKLDVLPMTLPICSGCERPIQDVWITAIGRTWHPQHFICAHCKKPIDLFSTDKEFIVGEDSPFHLSCFVEVFRRNCDICGKLCERTGLANFWGNVYCLQHEPDLTFCEYCGRLINRGDKNQYKDLRDGRLLCRTCHSNAVYQDTKARRVILLVVVSNDIVHKKVR